MIQRIANQEGLYDSFLQGALEHVPETDDTGLFLSSPVFSVVNMIDLPSYTVIDSEKERRRTQSVVPP